MAKIASIFAADLDRPDDPTHVRGVDHKWIARAEYLDDDVWFGSEGRGQTKAEAFRDLFRRLAIIEDLSVDRLTRKEGAA